MTGLPASGKSTITEFLVRELRARDVDVAVLESDVLRRVLYHTSSYEEADRDSFYRAMVWIGKLLTDHGVSVIFDATANRRRYRQRARSEIPRYLEVLVDCPLSVCMSRDPKGIYRSGKESDQNSVPGLGAAYEPPSAADVVVDGSMDAPEDAATRVLEALVERGYVGG
jgi:adenylylsulfate kinase